MFKYPFPHWDVLAWCLVLLAAIVLEVVGLIRPQEATLSALIRSTVPIWGRAMILGWLGWHFLLEK